MGPGHLTFLRYKLQNVGVLWQFKPLSRPPMWVVILDYLYILLTGNLIERKIYGSEFIVFV